MKKMGKKPVFTMRKTMMFIGSTWDRDAATATRVQRTPAKSNQRETGGVSLHHLASI